MITITSGSSITIDVTSELGGVIHALIVISIITDFRGYNDTLISLSVRSLSANICLYRHWLTDTDHVLYSSPFTHVCALKGHYIKRRSNRDSTIAWA